MQLQFVVSDELVFFANPMQLQTSIPGAGRGQIKSLYFRLIREA